MLLEIPLRNNEPSQKLSVLINQQNITIELWVIYSSGIEYIMSNIYINATLIVAGARCVHASYINQYITPLKGNLFFYSDDGLDPTYQRFGTISHLFYADYDALALDYNKWLSNVNLDPIQDITIDVSELVLNENNTVNITVTYSDGTTKLNPADLTVSANTNDAEVSKTGNGYVIKPINPTLLQITLSVSNRIYTKTIYVPVDNQNISIVNISVSAKDLNNNPISIPKVGTNYA